MGVPVLILGESGTGKSASMRNCTPDRFGIINVSKKPLPFKSNIKTFNTDDYGKIIGALKIAKVPSIVIDDSQYLLANELFDRANEKGYDKFTNMAANFRDLIHFVNELEDEDKIVYFLHHPETDSNTGRVKAKTIGRMLDEKLTLEGCFDIVLHAKTDGTEHWFSTQSDGTDTAKSPEEMFEAKIPNDLAFVDRTIRDYYGMGAV